MVELRALLNDDTDAAIVVVVTMLRIHGMTDAADSLTDDNLSPLGKYYHAQAYIQTLESLVKE
jgi:hypothetical protein